MFDIVDFISRIFKKEKADASRLKARERLKLVLVSDRANISPQLMESLKEELIEVISRYMTIDTSSIEMGLERKNGSMALAANIPILDVKRTKRSAKGTTAAPAKPPAAAKPPREAAPVPVPVPVAIVAEEPPLLEEAPPAPLMGADDGDAGSKAASAARKGKKFSKRFQARAQGRSLRKRAIA